MLFTIFAAVFMVVFPAAFAYWLYRRDLSEAALEMEDEKAILEAATDDYSK